jgi:hypothetical protein
MGGACIIHGREEKYRILERKLKGQIYVEDLGVDVRIKLKWFLKELKGVDWFHVFHVGRVGRLFWT